MKVLIISPNSPFLSVGGVERCVKNAIAYCQERDLHSTFLLPSILGDKGQEENGVSIHQKGFLLQEKNITPRKLKEKLILFHNYVAEIIDREGIDVILAENFHLGLSPGYSLMLNTVCSVKNIPMVLRVHSFPTRPIQEELIKNLFWSKVICVSKSVAGDCFEKGVDIDSLEVRYLGVDAKIFSPTNNRDWLRTRLNIIDSDRIVLAASRLVLGAKPILKEKGLICLIESFSKVARKYKNIKLLIASGKPPENLFQEYNDSRQKLMGFVKLHNLEKFVLCESFTLDEMPQVYSGSDIFALPSENETLGQVYIESMASGVPTIGTNVGGIPEIIHQEENGLLVMPNNASQLALAIEKLLLNNDMRIKLVQKALETVRERFAMRTLNDELFELLSQQVKS